MDILIRTLNQLPEGDDCIWQGGWLRLPNWLAEEGQTPVRMWTFFWTNPAFGYLHSSCTAHRREECTVDIPMRELINFARTPKHAGCRPRIVQVNDQDLARELAETLEATDIEAQYVPDLPIIEEVRADFYAQEGIEGIGPGLLGGQGVTIEQIRSFAEASALFYRAAPWDTLSSDDPILVETTQSPAPLKALSLIAVMGSLGQSYGLSFHRTYKAFQKMAYAQGRGRHHDPLASRSALWSVLFEPMHELVVPDADLWEDMELPVAGERAYPMPICFRPPEDLIRPKAKELNHMEACLRALAAVTEDEIDSGQFAREVQTHQGPVKLTMSLPMLLEPPSHQQIIRWGFTPDRRSSERVHEAIQKAIAGRDFGSMEEMQAVVNVEFSGKKLDDFSINTDTPQGKARDLCFRAFDSIGRRRRQLARQAIKIDPDCADAHVILAEETPNRVKARHYYEQGVAAGERTLGSKRFEEDAGEFWAMHDTRPYMRARAGLAHTVALLGEEPRAIESYLALLDLDPRDFMGLRFELFLMLQETQRYDEALRLIDRFSDDPWAAFKYGRALLLFHRDGDTTEARQALRAALKANRLVADYLLLPGRHPYGNADEGPDVRTRGEDDEIQAYNASLPLKSFIKGHPKARSWLNAEMKRLRRSGRRR